MFSAIADLVADWLADPTYGFAVGVPLVPVAPGKVRLVAPTLFRETLDDEAATLQAPDSLPALVVNTSGTLQQASRAIRPYPNDVETEVIVRHIVRDHRTTVAMAALDQGQRILQWSLGRLLTTSAGESARLRNQIQLLSLTAYRAELYRGNEETLLTMAHTYTLSVRDTWALVL